MAYLSLEHVRSTLETLRATVEASWTSQAVNKKSVGSVKPVKMTDEPIWMIEEHVGNLSGMSSLYERQQVFMVD